jgi:hypothetical protein
MADGCLPASLAGSGAISESTATGTQRERDALSADAENAAAMAPAEALASEKPPLTSDYMDIAQLRFSLGCSTTTQKEPLKQKLLAHIKEKGTCALCSCCRTVRRAPAISRRGRLCLIAPTPACHSPSKLPHLRPC